jgi:hypothetical protein
MKRGLPVAASSAVKVSASELTAYTVRPPRLTHTAWVLAVGLAEATSDRWAPVLVSMTPTVLVLNSPNHTDRPPRLWTMWCGPSPTAIVDVVPVALSMTETVSSLSLET